MITLTASAAYGFGGKQFVARILGRDPKFTFRREFIGRRGGKRDEITSADVDEPGLYEVRDIDRKGNADETYYLLMEVDGTQAPANGAGRKAGCDMEKRIGAEHAVREGGPVEKWLGKGQRIPGELRGIVLRAVEDEKAYMWGADVAVGYVPTTSPASAALAASLTSEVSPGKRVLGYLVLERSYRHPDALSVTGHYLYLRPRGPRAVSQKVIRILADV